MEISLGIKYTLMKIFFSIRASKKINYDDSNQRDKGTISGIKNSG